MALFDVPVYDETKDTWRRLQAVDIEAGAQELLRALRGQYMDRRGRPKAVNMDISKLQYVRGLRPAARKLLKNMRHTAQELPGTQEARKRMRFEIEGLRIRFGVPLFVTFSPDEAHQMLYVRMARTRCSDPVRAAPWDQDWNVGDRDYPPVDNDTTWPIHIETFRRLVPGWDLRRQALARDPLASVDGFRMLALLLLEHLFGVRTCPACPDCNHRDTGTEPCQDERGSNATVVGGVFGRMDAAYITIEAQKSTGSLHGHCQCFVQCLHQHTPLQEIFQLGCDRLAALRVAYLEYSGHVMHGTYAGHDAEAIAKGIADAEASWPEHKDAMALIQIPAYQQRRAWVAQQAAEEEGRAWAQEYLAQDVSTLQFLKQHHYHPPSGETGDRVPLHGCQKADRPVVCKSDFPREAWVTPVAAVLCPCQAEAHGMATQGRKNRVGALHGPYGNEWLNCCHPAMLASLRGANVDVQVPYRLPFDCQRCGSDLSAAQRQAIVCAAQRAQDAQTGYCADYCAKSQPMAFHEIKEMQKGQQRLQQSMQREPVEKIGQRTATRFLSDAYCKGIVRGQVECCNLRAYQKGSCVVAAERISTAAFCSFPGRALLQAVNVAVGEEAVGNSGSRYVWGKTGPGGRQSLREVNPAHAYGHRPSRPDIWCLSPYEFTTTWELEPLRIPRTRSEWQQLRGAHSDVTLTARGAAKCGAAGADNCKVRLLPGVDFRRAKGAESRNKAYYPSSAGNALCHAWCLRRKARPQCPQMASAPVPNRTGEDTESNAKMTMTYFRAWTLDKKRAGDTVLYIKHLREPGTTWDRSLRRWLLKLPCAETKQYVGNFLSVYRVRPETELHNSDNEDDKEELVVTDELLGIACQTHVAVEEDHNKESKWSKHRRLLVDALQRAEQHWGGCGVATSAPGEVENPYATTDTKGVVKLGSPQRHTEGMSGHSCWMELA